ncbi:flavodoxin-dependent (E)-4-hydroxy-3-methylbut-2-enyl-diphosphate synthase [Bacteroides ovatus]|nr:flavodoxin-dependent (E)-4-hydroxy-3-methylbut-2-enyl-diphosphate synthase [Bacteroides ovatus]
MTEFSCSIKGALSHAVVDATAFGILQAGRTRTSKRNIFLVPAVDVRSTIWRKQSLASKLPTSHLKGLKIGIMGCIVNGPGEMADADYGYVGAGRGKNQPV